MAANSGERTLRSSNRTGRRKQRGGGATGGGNHSTRGTKDQTKTQSPQSEGAVDGRTKTNSHVDAERSYLQVLEDGGVGGGNRSTGFDVLRTHSRKVATARQGQQVRTKTTILPVSGELPTNDRRRTATTMPTPTLTTTVTLRTKTTSLEVEIARRGSSFHESIR